MRLVLKCCIIERGRRSNNNIILAEQQPVGRRVELRQEPVSPSSD